MAAPGNGLSARLRQLKAAHERAKALPAKERLSFTPMRELLGVSTPVLREWCNEIEGFEASGAFVRGGNGIEWEFNPRKTVSFLVKHFEGKLSAQARRSKSIAKAVGVKLPESEEATSLSETKHLIEMTLTVVAAQEKQGRFMPVDEVSSFLAGYNEAVVNGILGVKTKVDPNGNLPPSIRQSIDAELRRLATSVHGIATSFIEEKRAGIQQGRTG